MTSEIITVQTPVCFHCRRAGFVQVLESDLEKYRNGMHAQEAFPEMPKELREQLISGTHPACWEEMFKDDEDE